MKISNPWACGLRFQRSLATPLLFLRLSCLLNPSVFAYRRWQKKAAMTCARASGVGRWSLSGCTSKRTTAYYSNLTTTNCCALSISMKLDKRSNMPLFVTFVFCSWNLLAGLPVWLVINIEFQASLNLTNDGLCVHCLFMPKNMIKMIR